jgi:hypothetical protein
MGLLGPSEDVRGLFGSLEQAIGKGPIEPFHVGGDACWRLVGAYRGRPVRVNVLSDGGILQAIVFTAPLGDRPITLMVHDRARTTILGVPEVRTGDPEFDRVYLVNGLPAEVLAEALDPATRGWIVGTFGERDPGIETEKGFVAVAVRLRVMEGAWAVPRGRVMPPAEIAEWLDAMHGLGDRLTSVYDRRRAAIAASQGEAAAQAWTSGHAAAMAARETRRTRIRLALLAIFVGLPVFAALGAIALLLAGLLLQR